MDSLISEGRLKSSIEVLAELEKKEDDLFDWCKERQKNLFVDIDDACQQEVSRIMGAYPRLVDTVNGRSGTDPFVIALARTMGVPAIVVTEENPGKQRIPDVCKAEKIEWIKLADLIEIEGWQFD
jgi:hypothetical protein